jgi:hypothetical protein
MLNLIETPRSILGILDGVTLANLPDDSRLTPTQTAQILNVSKDTLQIWRSTGRHNLPYVKVGGRVNYRVGDIRDWLTRRSRTHTGEVAA